jgi:hypothetical protein
MLVVVVHRHMRVRVSVTLAEMKIETGRHERSRRDGGTADCGLTAPPRRNGSDERCCREDRRGSPCTDAPLREKIEP